MQIVAVEVLEEGGVSELLVRFSSGSNVPIEFSPKGFMKKGAASVPNSTLNSLVLKFTHRSGEAEPCEISGSQ